MDQRGVHNVQSILEVIKKTNMSKITEATLRVSDNLIFRFVVDQFVENDLGDRPSQVKIITVFFSETQPYLCVDYYDGTFENFYGYKFSVLHT